MTRSHDSGHGVPEQKHDRHFNKSGQGDIRGEAKKGGQGAHNWGTEADEIDGDPIEVAEKMERHENEPRVQVKSAEEFEKEKKIAEASQVDAPMKATIADALPEELKK